MNIWGSIRPSPPFRGRVGLLSWRPLRKTLPAISSTLLLDFSGSFRCDEFTSLRAEHIKVARGQKMTRYFPEYKITPKILRLDGAVYWDTVKHSQK